MASYEECLQPFPYPDIYILALNEWYDSRYPAGPGWIKIEGELPRVRRTLITAIEVSALCFFVSIAPFVLRRWRTHQRRIRGQCLACGYDLTGMASARCPECGAAVLPTTIPSAAEIARTRPPTPPTPPPPGIFALVGLVFYAGILVHWFVYILTEWKDSAPAHPVDWWSYRHASAAVMLTCLFAGAFHWRRRRSRYLLVMGVSCILMGVWQVHDSRRGNFQYGVYIHDSEGNRVLTSDWSRDYINWPWLATVECLLRR